MACGILVPWPGIEPGATVVKALSPNHWTAREVPNFTTFLKFKEHTFAHNPKMTRSDGEVMSPWAALWKNLLVLGYSCFESSVKFYKNLSWEEMQISGSVLKIYFWPSYDVALTGSRIFNITG